MRRPLAIALLALAACAPAATAPPPACPPAAKAESPVAARIGDQTITLAEVDATIQGELFEAREGALDKLVTERVLAKAAADAKMTPEEYLRKEVMSRTPTVTDDEAKAFYEKNKGRLSERLRGKTFEELKPIIVEGLTDQKREQMVGDVLEELKKKAGVKVVLEAPRVEVAATGPSRGPSNAKVTIVEFSDFQCPYCARGRLVLDEVMKHYGNDVRLVFRDFPLSFHEHAEKAAEAGQCAAEQGKFWEMHDWMFEHQDKLSVDELRGAAKSLGLDAGKFDPCLDSGRYADAVAANVKAGGQAGVKGTPAFFVNGHFINGAQPFDKFKATIDRELGR